MHEGIMSRKTPPLNPLRVFECVARHGSVTRAAEELLVSQSAASRQVATLEEYLGVKLFIRDQRGVVLTKEGDIFHRDISPAFSAIRSATERLKDLTYTKPIKLQVYTTFAAKWLIKRLSKFKMEHPDIPINISTNIAPINFSKSDADAAIQLYDKESFQGDGEILFYDEIEALCSPSLFNKIEGRTREIAIFDYPILISRYRKKDLTDWLQHMKLNLPKNLEIIEFPSSILAYQAAMDNMGIIIGQTKMLNDEINSGSLIRLDKSPLTRSLAYYLVYPNEQLLSYRIKLFREWLLREIKSDYIA